MNFFKSLLI